MTTPEEQKRIDKRVVYKDKRDSETKVSISICWAINNAVACFSNIEKEDVRRGCIKTEMKWFLELYHDKMLEMMPVDEITIEPIKELDIPTDGN